MSKNGKGARLVIDDSNKCIMDNAVMSLNDAMEEYIQGTSRVLVFDEGDKIIIEWVDN